MKTEEKASKMLALMLRKNSISILDAVEYAKYLADTEGDALFELKKTQVLFRVKKLFDERVAENN